jgi:hypothetical protein
VRLQVAADQAAKHVDESRKPRQSRRAGRGHQPLGPSAASREPRLANSMFVAATRGETRVLGRRKIAARGTSRLRVSGRRRGWPDVSETRGHGCLARRSNRRRAEPADCCGLSLCRSTAPARPHDAAVGARLTRRRQGLTRCAVNGAWRRTRASRCWRRRRKPRCALRGSLRRLMTDVRDRRLVRRPMPAALGRARFVMTRTPSGRSGLYASFVGRESVTGAGAPRSPAAR